MHWHSYNVHIITRMWQIFILFRPFSVGYDIPYIAYTVHTSRWQSSDTERLRSTDIKTSSWVASFQRAMSLWYINIKIYKYLGIGMANEKCENPWVCPLLALFSLLISVSRLGHRWIQLDGKSEWFLSPMGSTSETLRWPKKKNHWLLPKVGGHTKTTRATDAYRMPNIGQHFPTLRQETTLDS